MQEAQPESQSESIRGQVGNGGALQSGEQGLCSRHPGELITQIKPSAESTLETTQSW